MNEIRIGDCRDVMRSLIAQGVKVQTVVTSPPYWGLRDYGIEPSVWGGDPNHAHQWVESGQRIRRSGGSSSSALATPENGLTAETIEKKVRRRSVDALTGQFCECGAWLGSLGLEPDYRLYLEHMVEVFGLVWQILDRSGTVWLNLGDNYISDGGTGFQGKHGDRYQRTHTQRTLLLNRVGNGMKNKDLAMMPARTAIALQDAGWWVRSDIIWHKLNPTPESVYDRPTKAHEYIYLLAKSATPTCWRHRESGEWVFERPAPQWRWINRDTREVVSSVPADAARWRRFNLWRGFDYFYDADAIKEPSSPNSHPRLARAHNGYHPPGQHEQAGILAPRPNAKARRPGGWAETGTHKDLIGRYPRLERGKQNESFVAAISSSDLVEDRNKRSVWSLATSPYQGEHFATFPPTLIEPCILAGSMPGQVVFDPFIGSGTTAMVAKRLGRKYLGADINPNNAPLQRERLQTTAGLEL